MSKSSVFFIPVQSEKKEEKSAFSIETALGHRMFRLLDGFENHHLVGIKLHMSPDGKNTYISPEYAKTIAQALKKREVHSFFCDTSNRFRDQHDNAVTHVNNLRTESFPPEDNGTPVFMLDGVNGNYEVTVDIEKSAGARAYLSGELENIDGLVLMANPFADLPKQFDGAVRGMGLGLASKKGKIRQHTISKPKVNSERCYYCRKCLHQCPTNAIYVEDRHVEIDGKKCIDCGKCVEIAQYGGISYEWNAPAQESFKRCLNHARGVQQILQNHIIFCNFLLASDSNKNSKDIGVLLSRDPVAIDKASLDLTENIEINSEIHPLEVLQQAEQLGLGQMEYNLELVSY